MLIVIWVKYELEPISLFVVERMGIFTRYIHDVFHRLETPIVQNRHEFG
jgi:hypothetical protein